MENKWKLNGANRFYITAKGFREAERVFARPRGKGLRDGLLTYAATSDDAPVTAKDYARTFGDNEKTVLLELRKMNYDKLLTVWKGSRCEKIPSVML